MTSYVSFQQKQDVKEWYTLKGVKTGEIQLSVIVNLPEKVSFYRIPDESENARHFNAYYYLMRCTLFDSTGSFFHFIFILFMFIFISKMFTLGYNSV